jgi:hypothetical protein
MSEAAYRVWITIYGATVFAIFNLCIFHLCLLASAILNPQCSRPRRPFTHFFCVGK